jgi:hypothetical protein
MMKGIYDKMVMNTKFEKANPESCMYFKPVMTCVQEVPGLSHGQLPIAMSIPSKV